MTQKLRVLIATEGGKKTGFGHLTRCLALYRAFHEKQCRVSLIVNGDNTINKIFGNKGNINIFNWILDSKRLEQIVLKHDIVIIDSYLANLSIYKKLSEINKNCVYIDDNHRLSYPKGIILNTNAYANMLFKQKNKNHTLLLGPKFSLLRSEFWKTKDKKINTNIKQILITFGGDDSRHMTLKIVRLLNNHFPNIYKNIIIGAGFKNQEEFKKLKNNHCRFYYSPAPYIIQKLMFDADIAVTAAGQTIYELLCTGTPTIAISVADNQLYNAKYLAKQKNINYAGNWNHPKLQNKIITKIQEMADINIRQQMQIDGRQLVNPTGAIYTVNKIRNIYIQNNLKIKRANKDDMRLVLSLSNKPNIRKISFRPEPITFAQHNKWYISQIKNSSVIFLLAKIDETLVGQVRLDFKTDPTLSISVHPLYAGLSIGKLLFLNLVKIVRENHNQIKNITAFVKYDNTASVSFFQSLGFIVKDRVVINNDKVFKYIYDLK